jgi:hypothetical protein
MIKTAGAFGTGFVPIGHLCCFLFQSERNILEDIQMGK